MDLEKYVEIERKTTSPMSKKVAKSRIRHIKVYGFRIEVVGQIESAYGQAHRILRMHLEVLGNPRIHGKKRGKSAGVGNSHIILLGVGHNVGKTATVFDHRSDAEFPRQLHQPPREKPVGQVRRQIAELVRPQDRQRKGAQETPEIVQVAPPLAPYVGEHQLARFPKAKKRRHLKLAV